MPTAKVIHGDSKDVLKTLPDNSIDAILTDPPYELNFMNKGWDASGIAYDVDLWRECLRVLKPGGHLLSFGAPRTYHRMAVAVEDAGFDVRDMIHWVTGTGFPKGVNVSKAIDKRLGAERPVIGKMAAPFKPGLTPTGLVWVGTEAPDVTASATDEPRRWDGWHSAMKPSHEPILVARKPFKGTLVDNVLTYGTGAYNIDSTRVGTDGGSANQHFPREDSKTAYGDGLNGNKPSQPTGKGRWTPNTILTHDPDCGTSKPHGDDLVYVCADGCPVAELDRQSGMTKSGKMSASQQRTVDHTFAFGFKKDTNTATRDYPGDEGGASRFYPALIYQAKAPARERPVVDGVRHPTVKPLALMRHLARLVTPPDGTILDPFAGSGATLQAALDEGFNAIGIELETKHIPLIMKRLEGYDIEDPA